MIFIERLFLHLMVSLACLGASMCGHTARAQVEAEAKLSERFQVAVSYGVGDVSLEVEGRRELEQEPSVLAYEDGMPVSGSFKSGATRYQRTSFAYLFEREQRSYFAGLALENLSLGAGGSPLRKSGGTEAEFQLNALSLELGALRRLSGFTQASGSIAIDHFLDGKLRSRYLTRSPEQSGGPKYAVVEDKLKSGNRISLSGDYVVHLSPGLSLGVKLSAHYGSFKLEQRSPRSGLFGYTFGVKLLLRI